MTQTVMTPVQRRAAFKSAVVLMETTAAKAAHSLGVSYNHLMLVLNGERTASARLRAAIAEFIGAPESAAFGDRVKSAPPAK